VEIVRSKEGSSASVDMPSVFLKENPAGIRGGLKDQEGIIKIYAEEENQRTAGSCCFATVLIEGSDEMPEWHRGALKTKAAYT